ncbi:unnamed protein product [Brachionus calyciflorus]|uniref:Uncharacterized protein n=1 Tax=Brachionus calyciflorus TaxID=104777 RepID=A0A813RJ00_9BILA|nr:unnamed protein product [Brachionus calyciflorus]
MRIENNLYDKSLQIDDINLRQDCQNLLKSLKSTNKLLIESLSKNNENEQHKSRDQSKTVTFSDYLRTFKQKSPRSFSNEPRFSENAKFKSILKKNSNTSLNSNLNDEFTKSTVSISSRDDDSLSKVRSLSNIYADLDLEDNFEEKIKYIIKYTDLNNDSKFINKKSMIDYISKKRQKYLAHDYGDDDRLINSSTKSEKVNQNTRFQNQNSKTKKRSKSADCIYSKSTMEKECKKPTISTFKLEKNKKSRDYKKTAKNAKKNKPLLGLDWALDNVTVRKEISTLDKSDDYWKELSEFRNENKRDCISSKGNCFNGSINSVLENESSFFRKQMIGSTEDELVEGINHKCIHSYTLNDRLFPVPVYKDKNGQSLCPVCKSTQKEANSISPQFFKISIPKSKVIDTISIEQKKTSSKNPEDTLSLAENCASGQNNHLLLKNAKTSKCIDLKSSTNNKDKPRKLTLEELRQIQSNRDPATSTLYSKANAMRFDLEDLHQKRLRELMPRFN